MLKLFFISTLLALVFSFQSLSPARADESSWYDQWLKRASEIQAEQPHWVTPVVTVTPRLEQEFRTDTVFQYSPKGHALGNFGNGKGLELIPVDPIEVIFNVPAYLEHNNPRIKDGFADFSMLVKYRLLSANEENGNYILTAFLGLSLPTATGANGSGTTVVTPSISGGKGMANFDLLSTLGITLPFSDTEALGHNLSLNTALQYHFKDFFAWPELEDNFSHFFGGENAGKSQNYLTPGIIFGKFVLHERTGVSIGTGYQVATSDYRPYQHAWIFTARLPF